MKWHAVRYPHFCEFPPGGDHALMDPQSPTQTPIAGTEYRAAAQASPHLRRGGTISSNREIAVVQADYLALANDLEQAQALASSLEIQLSGKTNELARFKLIWERTQADLLKFEQDLDKLRKERHALANDLQRAYAFEHKYEKVKASHEELLAKCARLEAELSGERTAHVKSREELADLRDEFAARLAKLGAGVPAPDPALRQSLLALRTQLDRVLTGGAGGAGGAAAPAARPAATERIDIEFDA